MAQTGGRWRGGPAGSAEGWAARGVWVGSGVLGTETVRRLSAWVRELEADAASPEGPALALHHREQTDHGPVLARSERFADSHEGLGAFVRGEAARIVGSVLGEPVVLFKEKVNYKQPGGAGFAPHQDARAYRFVDHHVSLMVPLDPATQQAGCLWFATDAERRLLDAEEGGRLTAEVERSLAWVPVEVAPGDVVVFDSLAPHRSGSNASDHPRRALYITYNSAADGDHRDRYYADKDAEFAVADGTFGGRRVRMSISDDYLGRPVAFDSLASLYDSPLAHELYDEAVSELEHGLQAAALAEAGGASDELVVAALLHDVGHLLLGDLAPIEESLDADHRHEGAGARYLRQWFGPGVAEPVALHVAAKRYLCSVDPDYPEMLSPSSVRSLEVQGGPMSPGQVEAFEASPRHGDAVRLRRWDDEAKVSGAATPPFAHFEPMIDRLAGRLGR